jgi:two-component system chemotaxis response regulator CheB
MGKKIKVLIVDDSAIVRQTLSNIFSSDEDMEVIGAAKDPFDAAELLKTMVPDVITLDIEMPRMDGITFLKKIMSLHPIPIVIISQVAQEGSKKAFEALEFGAVEVIAKPKINSTKFFEESKILLCDIIKAASVARVRRISLVHNIIVKPKLSADVIIPKKEPKYYPENNQKIIVIGASTGGTEAISQILKEINTTVAGIVIVQHMPEMFTRLFAERLNEINSAFVTEAKNGDTVERGKVLIAPGNKHLVLKNSGSKYFVEVKDGPLVNRHRPSIDVLFRSAAQNAGKNAIGILLTGMGDDGAHGLLELKEAGAHTIAQDEQSCVVYGMPKEAFELGAVKEVLNLSRIAQQITVLGK